MLLITGPMFAGKKEYAKSLGFDTASMVYDAQKLVRTHDDLEVLADELAAKQVVICTEVGGGIVPIDKDERIFRERAGRLSVLLAKRAEKVVRIWCGLPQVLKEDRPC